MSSYQQRVEERDRIAKAFIEFARAEGYTDDQIVKALIEHDIIRVKPDLTNAIAKALAPNLPSFETAEDGSAVIKSEAGSTLRGAIANALKNPANS